MKQQLGKGKLETLVAQLLIDGEYPVEFPFLLCFIKTKKKVTRFLNTMAYRLVQLFITYNLILTACTITNFLHAQTFDCCVECDYFRPYLIL